MVSNASLNHVYRTVWNASLGAMVAVAEISSGRGKSSAGPSGSAGAAHGTALRITLSALAIALAWGSGQQAWANPAGGVAVHGQATMTSNGNALTVTTQNGAGTNHSAINWQSFSIPAGSSTYFNQPNQASTVINRVVTATPSLIFGTMGSNGNVVLVNQSGITVGAGAVVDTAGFTASALRMSDADALAGRVRLGGGEVGGGDVNVQGSILARSGDVVLVGANVNTSQQALVHSPNGSTILAAGQQVEITGRGLEGISLQVQAPDNSAVNLGTLKGDAVGIFASTLKHSGAIAAAAVTTAGGKVVLKAADTLTVDGSVQASATQARGGSVHATANKVLIKSGAVLDASGDLGGGEVLVGGGFKGQDARVSNAQTTLVESGAQLKADARVNGDGGQVVVWADGLTRYAGSLSAQGGAQGGNGGNAEVSGKQVLDYRGTANLKAANGSKGALLLDPSNLTITVDNVDDTTTADSQISVSTLVSMLDAADVTLEAIGNIDVKAAIDYVNVQIPRAAVLNLTSTSGDIRIYESIQATSEALSLALSAGNNIKIDKTINTNGGSVNLAALNHIQVDQTITTSGGSVSMNAGGGSGISAAAINTKGLDFAVGRSGSGGGSVELIASNGNIVVGPIDSRGGAAAASASVTGFAGGSGGSVTIVRGTGDLSLTALDINTSGGAGGTSSASPGGDGGAAGNISIAANNGKVILSGGSLRADGAVGGNGSSQGSSGAAGQIEIGIANFDGALTTGLEFSGDIAMSATSGNTGFDSPVKLISGADGVNQISGKLAGFGGSGVGFNIQTDGSVHLNEATNNISYLSAEGSSGYGSSVNGFILANGVQAVGNISTIGNVTIGSNGMLTLNGDIKSGGGNVDLSAANGIVEGGFGRVINSTGQGDAGNITLNAGGNIELTRIDAYGMTTVSTVAGQELPLLFAVASVGSPTGVAGNGGAVSLTAGGIVKVTTGIDSRGADGAAGTVDAIVGLVGGKGGSITVRANDDGSSSTSTLGEVLASGGIGGLNYGTLTNADSGAGGAVTIDVKHHLDLTSNLTTNAAIDVRASGDITQYQFDSCGECGLEDSVISNTGTYVAIAPSISLVGNNISLMGVKSNGDITVTATGSVSTDPNATSSFINSAGGNIVLNAASVSLDLIDSTTGGLGGKVNGGNVSVTSTSGSIQLGAVNTYGDFETIGGGNAGNVTLIAVTNVVVSNSIDASGGDGTVAAPLDGGAGGNVVVTAGGTINFGVDAFSGSIYTSGGEGGVLNGTSQAGGKGGNVTLSAGASTANPSSPSIVRAVIAGGGAGGSGNTAKDGLGGNISISSTQDLNAVGNVFTNGKVDLVAAGALNLSGAIDNSKTDPSAVAQNVLLRGGNALVVNSVVSSGNVTLTKDTGDLVFATSGTFSAGSVTLNATAGAISQTSAISTTGLLKTNSSTGAVLENANNAVSAFMANNTTSGNVSLKTGSAASPMTSPLDIQGITNTGGAVIIESWGGVTTNGLIKAVAAPPAAAANGGVTFKTHSPLTVGSGGISASGNILLEAMTDSTSSNILLNGGLSSSAGGITVNAANTFTQNSFITAAAGVSVGAGSVTYGPNATTVGSPVSYTAAGVSVAPPPTSLASATQDTGTTNTDVLTAFVNNYDEALAAQEADNNNPFGRKKSDIVVEGEICAP